MKMWYILSKKNFNLQILHMELLKGYDLKADSMFVAVLKKIIWHAIGLMLPTRK